MTEFDTLLSNEEVAAIGRPIESARSFPRRAFTSAEFFEIEMRQVYNRNWAGLCFASQVAAAGDVQPVDAFGIPLLVVHGDDGRVRVFHNVCPYDGCPVSLGPARGLNAMTVAYHGWRYDLSGELTDAPYWNGHSRSGVDDVPPEYRRLVEVSSGIALETVFVDLSGAAGPLEQHLRGVLGLLTEFDLDGLTVARAEDGEPDRFVDEVATNWKTFVENDCLNILHESFTHAMYAESPDIPRVDDEGRPRFEVLDRDDVFGFSYLESDVLATYPRSDLPHIGRAGRPQQGFFVQLYPNVSLAVMPSLIAPLILHPVAADRTLVTGTVLVSPDAANGPPAAGSAGAGFAVAAAEDAAVTEAIQRGRRSPAYDQTFYSPFWDQPHYRFTQRVLLDLLAD